MAAGPPVAARITAVSDALAKLLDQFQQWDSYKQTPGMVDLTLGNPQEMPLTGFVTALVRHTEPHNKDWFAYKKSEPAARATIARSLQQ